MGRFNTQQTALRRYPVNSLGDDVDLFVCPVVAYTTDATFAAFVENAVEGEIGIYNADTNALITGTQLTDGQRFFIAQKRGANITGNTHSVHRSIDMTWRSNQIRTQDQVASVRHNFNVLVNTGASAVGQRWNLRVEDTTYNTAPYPVIEFEFISESGNETAAQVAAGLRNNYNTTQASSERRGGYDPFITVSGSGANVVITAAYDRTRLLLTTRDQFSNRSTRTITETRVNPGIGNGAIVAHLEEQSNLNYGHNWTNTMRFEDGGSPTILGRTASTYDFIHIESTQTTLNGSSAGDQFSNFTTKALLAIETTSSGTSGSVLYTALQAIL